MVGSWEAQTIIHFNEINDVGFGAGFTGVFGEALEVHASLMYDKTYQKYFNGLIDDGQFLSVQDPMEFFDQSDGFQWMVGGAYTWTNNLTMNVEYWHDDSGYSKSEWGQLAGLAMTQRSIFSDGNTSEVARNGNLQWSSQVYRQQNIMEEYMAVRLYFTRDDQDVSSYIIYSIPDSGWIGNLSYGRPVGRNHDFSVGIRLYGGSRLSAYKNFFTKHQFYLSWEGVFSI